MNLKYIIVLLILLYPASANMSINNDSIFTYSPNVFILIENQTLDNLTFNESWNTTQINITLLAFNYTFTNTTDGLKTIYLYNNSNFSFSDSIYLLQSPPPIYRKIVNNSTVTLTPLYNFYPVNSIQETIPMEFGITSSYLFTKKGTTYFFNNTNNVSYNLTPLTEVYRIYNISGIYYNDNLSYTIPKTDFFYYSPYKDLYTKYDTVINNKIDRNELLFAVREYFESKTSIDFIKKLVERFQTNGELN